jgi:hypothetical protein
LKRRRRKNPWSPWGFAPSDLLVGSIASLGFTAAGAIVTGTQSSWDKRATVEGAAGGLMVGALAGVGLAFVPSLRAIGVGMIGIGGALGLAGLATNALGGGTPPMTGKNYQVTLATGQTLIQRMAVGDTITVLAPLGWGLPAIEAASPVGTLAVYTSDASTSSATFRAAVSGSAEVGATDPSDASSTATVSVDVS